MRRRLIAGAAALALTTTTLTAPAAAEPVAGLPTTSFPLGAPGIPKSAAKSLGPGISYFTLRHGSAKDGYTVSVVVAGKDFMSESNAQAQADAVQVAGFTPTVVKFTRPAVADFPAGDYYMVRVGGWPLSQKAEAAKVVKQLKDAGVSAKVDFQGDDGFVTTGPWSVRVIVVDPRTFRGSYRSSVGTSVAKREKVSAMATAAKAVAAVNGGFFDIHTLPAFRGDPTGISVVGGKLLSEAVPGRVGLVLKGRTARVTELSSSVVARAADGTTVQVAGLNRVPQPDEVVLYTEELGRETPKDDGVEAVLDATGKVLAVRDTGGKVTRGMRVLHGVGAGADWLSEHVTEGTTVRITTRVTDLRTKRAVPLTPETNIIGGAVGLVRGGRTTITPGRDGMANTNMILRRHPRTLAGVTRNGKLVIAVVDGRDPGGTIGASFFEAAELMRWLGARDAINLDGGGSSAMVIGKKVVNHPSDGVERGVGDALLIVPAP
ncbi:phosphodiester glycosidase family protein [Microbispora cellulosiformans]|uniref:Phosphodiester glycosidase family protein n=1 Tax=Microbispora cellulosiformans TaxID=2614688 RepID=A0A5J5JUI3_9ACTN|nr:phosphodiester glycosidase family protein [Microbispora cellulosiformans]KAA9373208.1 phosphodiester glycosidase family protein [Microbispora cellulosiformans]